MTAVLSYITINDLPVLDPRSLSMQAMARDYDDRDWRGLANSISIPRGSDPTEAHLLLSHDTLSKVAGDGLAGGYGLSTLKLTVEARNEDSEDFPGIDDITIPNLYIHASKAIMAPWEESESVFLVTFRGPRQLAAMSFIDEAYNVTSPYYADRSDVGSATIDYWAQSLNNGSAWTWQEMLDDIWSKLPGMGQSPDYSTANIPSASNALPLNYRFHGWSAWDAYMHLLIDLGNYIVPDIYGSVEGTPRWRVIAQEATAPENPAWEAAKTVPTNLSHPRQVLTTRVPETIKVVFPAQRWQYQFDQDDNVTTSRDAFNSQPTYVVSISGPAGAYPGTVVTMRDATPAYFDLVTGAIVNQAKLDYVANYMATNYIARQTGVDRDDHYSGLHRLLPEHGISVVEFFDYGKGWQTRIVREFKGLKRPQHESDTAHWFPEEAKEVIPYERQAYVLVTSPVGSGGSIIPPGGIGKGNLLWWNPDTTAWAEVTPTREVFFYNAGLGDIDLSLGTTYAWLEYWWQTKAYITFCGFVETSA